MTPRHLLLGLLFLSQLACGEVLLPDGSLAGPDGAVDSGLDASQIADSGIQADTGAIPDSGLEPDAGVPPDSGLEPDTGVPPDSGLEPDAGFPDAGVDAGPADSGLLAVQVQIEPRPLGLVEIQPASVTCPPQCQSEVVPGSTVTFDATPLPGYRFSHWGQACSAQTGQCTLSPSLPTAVEAWFQPGGVEWVQAWSDPALLRDVAMDSQGAAYLLFSFVGSMSVPGLGAYTQSGFLVLKLDASGAPIWAKHIIATPSSAGALAVTPSHVYVAVSSSSDFAVPPSPAVVPNQGGYDILALDLDPLSGDETARFTTATGSGSDLVNDVAADSSGFYLAGQFESPVLQIGQVVIAKDVAASNSAFVLNIASATPWGQSFGGSASAFADSLALTPNGLLYVAGRYSSSDFQLGTPLPPPANSTRAAFTALLTAGSGQPQWARAFNAGATFTHLTTVGTDVVAVGYFTGTLTLENGPVLTAITFDAFLLRLSSTGAFSAVHKFGSDTAVVPSGLTALPSGEVAVMLRFAGLLVLDRLDSSIGPETRFSQGANDVYVAVLAPSGQMYSRSWEQIFASSEDEAGVQLAASGARLVGAIVRVPNGTTPFGPYNPTGRSFLVSLGL